MNPYLTITPPTGAAQKIYLMGAPAPPTNPSAYMFLPDGTFIVPANTAPPPVNAYYILPTAAAKPAPAPMYMYATMTTHSPPAPKFPMPGAWPAGTKLPAGSFIVPAAPQPQEKKKPKWSVLAPGEAAPHGMSTWQF